MGEKKVVPQSHSFATFLREVELVDDGDWSDVCDVGYSDSSNRRGASTDGGTETDTGAPGRADSAKWVLLRWDGREGRNCEALSRAMQNHVVNGAASWHNAHAPATCLQSCGSSLLSRWPPHVWLGYREEDIAMRSEGNDHDRGRRVDAESLVVSFRSLTYGPVA